MRITGEKGEPQPGKPPGLNEHGYTQTLISADYADFALSFAHAADRLKPLSYEQVSISLV